MYSPSVLKYYNSTAALIYILASCIIITTVRDIEGGREKQRNRKTLN